MGLPRKVQEGHLSRVPLAVSQPHGAEEVPSPPGSTPDPLVRAPGTGASSTNCLCSSLRTEPLGSHSLAWEAEEEGEELPICQRAEGGLRARLLDPGCPYLSPMSRRASV